MKIIDIKSRSLHDDELPKTPGVHVQLHIEKMEPHQAKSAPYELEVGRKKSEVRLSLFHPLKTFWRFVKSIRFVRFTFLTHFGLKKYRVHTSFFLGCFVALLVFALFAFIGGALQTKIALSSDGKNVFQELAKAKQGAMDGNLLELPKHLGAAAFGIKDAQKSLASLGEIPELLANAPLSKAGSFKEDISTLSIGSAWAEFFLRVAGFYEPRYYLILFQNNAEIRATGGFIGSYALLKVSEGNVEIKKAEGAFNVSGQQSLLLTPPEAIQKISENWTLHDGNWFFDFPASARFISRLYEKDGGPTINGVITITPQVLEHILSLTGPVELKEYGLTLTKDNVIDTLQSEVEVNYKTRNLKDPKEIITALTPLLLDKIKKDLDVSQLSAMLLDSLKSKDVLTYLADEKEQSFLLSQNWGGAMLEGDGDYLAVVNSNINGYKTDRVVSQRIGLKTEFMEDGDIVDTVTITREHNGKNSPFPWYDKVNADFLRVYVPKGSELLDARGQTMEFDPPRIDYARAHFKTEPLLDEVNKTLTIDQKTGTRVFQEGGKTVFGNWAYVSPGEKVEVTYRYRLPFRTNFSYGTFPFALTLQKQSGITSLFSWNKSYPQQWREAWTSQEPQELSHDMRLGTLLSKEE